MPEERIQSWMSLVIYFAINTGADVFFSGEFYEDLLPAGGHAKPSRVPSACQDSKVRFWTALHHSSQITPLPVLLPPLSLIAFLFSPWRSSLWPPVLTMLPAMPVLSWVLGCVSVLSLPPGHTCLFCPVALWVGSMLTPFRTPPSQAPFTKPGPSSGVGLGRLDSKCFPWVLLTLSPDFLWEKNFSVEYDLWQIESITILYVPEWNHRVLLFNYFMFQHIHIT